MSILERIPELACPVCKGDLEFRSGLCCKSCDKHYEVHDDIPYMLVEDMLDFAEEIAVQDSVAIEYEEKRYCVPYAKKYHQWCVEQMLSRVQTDGRILDNGCGIGLLYEKIPAKRLVGIDLSREMLRRAGKFSDQLVLGNSQQLPFKADSFDLVFCRSLLHHLPAPELAVQEMHRVLRPGGQIVLAETNSSLLSTLPRKIANRSKHFSEVHANLSRRTLESLLEPCFVVDDVSYFGYIAYPLLGFPDVVNIFRFVPFKSIAVPVLMGLDGILSRIPLVRTQSWGIILKGTALAER